MSLPSTLALILFFCAVLFGSLIVMGKIMYFQQKEEGERKYSWWGFAVRFPIWIINAFIFTDFVESPLLKAMILLAGIGIATAIEVFHMKYFNEQSQSMKETQW